jgi:hypothetical protein
MPISVSKSSLLRLLLLLLLPLGRHYSKKLVSYILSNWLISVKTIDYLYLHILKSPPMVSPPYRGGGVRVLPRP